MAGSFETSNRSVEKPDSLKASYTRKFLKQNNISDDDFCKMAEKVGVNILSQEIYNDSVLVSKVKELQSKIGLKANTSKHVLDGMFGPFTYRELTEKINSGQRKKVSDIVTTDLVSARTDPALADQPKKTLTPSIPDVKLGNEKISKLMDKFEGQKEVVRLPGNGGRESVIYIPRGFDPNKPAEIVYHFHGTHSQLIDTPLPNLPGTSKNYRRLAGQNTVGSNRLTQAVDSINQTSSNGRNVILVYPFSAGRRGAIGSTAYKEGYDGDWMKKNNSTSDDMQTFHQSSIQEINKILGTNLKNMTITLSGHSAGGLALKNILESGFKPNKVKFLDASYGSWASKAYAETPSSTQFEFYVRPGTNTDNSSVAIVAKKPNSKIIYSKITHGDFVKTFV